VAISPAQDIVRFGVFELDVRTRELRKGGMKIRLPQQPMRLLSVLLERPSELFTRDELRGRIWAADVFVDFDQGLNKSIRKLREVLGDSAGSPRFIETMPREGYRFIAPVSAGALTTAGSAEAQTFAPAAPAAPAATEALVGTAEPVGLAELAGSAGPARPGAVPRPEAAVATAGDASATSHWVWAWSRRLPVPTPAGPRSRVGGWVRTALLTGGIAACSVAAVWLIQRRWHGTEPVRSLAVLPLENLSGDAGQEYFADGMTDELITELANIPTLRVVSRTSVMRNKGTHKPLQDIARELNVDSIVEGSVVRFGDKVRITAQLIDARDDRHLWAQSFRGQTSDMLSLQAGIAREIASQVRVVLMPERRAPEQSER
jgi:TolB-like protein/DNA-binding winged helix-turn-helix (wHTH) protein